MADSKKGGKNRKYGKNKKDPAMARYTAERRRFKNKLKKMKRHIRRHPDDTNAARNLVRVEKAF